MSLGLYYRPVPKDIPPAEELPYELKAIISRRYLGSDGSVRGECVLDRGDTAYLEGIADSYGPAADGAAELVQAIREHGAVTLWIGEADD